jgi:hypothetical protein
LILSARSQFWAFWLFFFNARSFFCFAAFAFQNSSSLMMMMRLFRQSTQGLLRNGIPCAAAAYE